MGLSRGDRRNCWITPRARRAVGAVARGLLGLAAVALLTVGAGPAEAQNRGGVGQSCTIYYHGDYRGASVEFRPGEEAPWYGSRWNDQVSSVRVAQGCELQIWEHVTFQGLRAVITRDTPYIGPAWNDRVSSSICRCQAPTLTGGRTFGQEDLLFGRDSRDAPRQLSRRGLSCVLYQGANFDGPWRAFREADDRRRLGRRLRNDVSSVRVADGCVAMLDVGAPYKIFVDQDVAQFPIDLDNTAQSVDCFCR